MTEEKKKAPSNQVIVKFLREYRTHHKPGDTKEVNVDFALLLEELKMAKIIKGKAYADKVKAMQAKERKDRMIAEARMEK